MSALDRVPELRQRKHSLFVRRDAHIHAGRIHRPQKRSTRRRKNQAHAGRREQVFLDRQDGVVHRVDVGSFGRVNVDVELRFVNVGGYVLLFHYAIKRDAGQRDRDGNYGHDRAVAHCQLQQRGVRAID